MGSTILALASAFLSAHQVQAPAAIDEAGAASLPNIVIILADDLGVGEVGYGGGIVPTPHIDRLAAEGRCFTDAHSSSAVCTPSRYSLLTGRYAWRTRLKSGVFSDVTSKPLIEPERRTLADLCQGSGYRTAVVGKWHLGLGWKLLAEDDVPADLAKGRTYGSWRVNYGAPFTGGPLDLGFDEFFGVCASLDMPPYVWCDGDRVPAPPTVNKTWVRKGAASEDFEASLVLAGLAARSRAFIEASAEGSRPFMLYLPLTSPHTPIVPGAKFRGTTEWGDYSDFLAETDWVVGEVLAQLDESKVAGDTLVFLSSDNGFAPYVKIPELREAGQKPSGRYRGAKADIYEGGHRVPFVARWPGVIEAGSSSDRTICLVDMFATVGALLGADGETGEDSLSFLPALKGEAQPPRPFTIHHSINGSFAIRRGKWKLCLCPGSGGWSDPKPKQARERVGADVDPLPAVQLFDLAVDPSEQTNVSSSHPGVVKELAGFLEAARATVPSEAGR